MRKYLIGTGYFSEKEPKLEWVKLWFENTRRGQEADVVNFRPRLPVTLAVGPVVHPLSPLDGVMNLDGNLGHINDLVVTKTKPHAYCGWSGAMLALALIAYCEEADFIYKEEDCLAFGPWIQRMYEELGDGKVIHGSCQIQPAAQSLFLVKHDYIPEFVRGYLAEGPDNNEHNLPEMKFDRLGKKNGWKRFSFGYDRDRPFNVKDEVFYVQQVTPEEMTLLRDAGLIYCAAHLTGASGTVRHAGHA